MKTLILLIMIAVGVAGILYCRVNLGMSWDDMSKSISGLLPRMLSLLAVFGAFAATLLYMNRDRSE